MKKKEVTMKKYKKGAASFYVVAISTLILVDCIGGVADFE